MYQEIINDCEYLKNLFEIDDNEESVISQIKNRNLVDQFYSGNFDFSNEELLILAEEFRFLICSRIKEILILMKNNDKKYFKKKLNKYLIPDYDDIILQKDLYLTLVYYDCSKPLQWLQSKNYPFDLDKAIELAIRVGNLSTLKYLVSIDGNINNEDYLKIIGEKGYLNLLIYFIELLYPGQNLKPNIKFNKPLIYASGNGHYDVVELLLKNGANIHTQNDWPLMVASGNGHYEVVKLLLKNDANIHADNDGALRFASQNGHYEIAKLLLENEAYIHAINNAALRIASKRGRYEIVKLLLKNGANIHAQNNESLRIASENGHYEIVKLLLENGSNVHTDDDRALIYASYNGHYDVVKLLLENDANIHARNNWALILASSKGHYEVVKLLLENGADIHAQGDKALMLASFYNHYEVIKLLENWAHNN